MCLQGHNLTQRASNRESPTFLKVCAGKHVDVNANAALTMSQSASAAGQLLLEHLLNTTQAVYLDETGFRSVLFCFVLLFCSVYKPDTW
jgi:hypothetical protein